ncbi:YdeI/OmpD-associated family protein [Pedobacter faecalis]|uniref:YdeI/OmpD-associated family protein n=1 Tax=Pedobacter faecalis TaxID=3041495 RepID=UPI00254D6B07|nr:YdeI/OmpD-associated family protein [Pedobacter sp. ELA7]
MEQIEIFYPETVADWNEWLAANHQKKQSVWLVQHHKASGRPTVSWSEAVDVALCYGWIDSKKIKIDQYTTHQFFSRRKPKSTWSKINKDKVEQLVKEGLMSDAGYESIRIAKENGSWNVLDEVEALQVPADLQQAFDANPGAEAYYNSLSKSIKKMMLHWIVLAKRPETRLSRIQEIASHAAEGTKPKQF